MLTLVLGGARSGKSAFSEKYCKDTGKNPVYLATATAGDEEMAGRIQHHQQTRGTGWVLVEEPLFLADALIKHSSNKTCVLVDCLTLWLTNLLLHKNADLFEQETDKLLQQINSLPGDAVLVSNEVGLGLVAADPLSRRFVDESGRLHQALAQRCDAVFLVTAGIPQKLKPANA